MKEDRLNGKIFTKAQTRRPDYLGIIKNYSLADVIEHVCLSS